MWSRGARAGPLSDAWLLVGPTGSGKSPTGELLARRTGRFHLDFGHHLREIAAGRRVVDLSPEEEAFVRRLLAARSLFPDADFPLAARIVEGILARRAGDRKVILNGIPRHVAQARRIGGLLEISRVIVLHCPAEVAAGRVARRRRGSSEDHAGRDDDAPEDVREKLRLYEAETRPLVQWYRRRGVRVLSLPVTLTTTAEDLVAGLGLSDPDGRG
ncbi:MAG: nucleoside monophosphate kinase [Acidobacteriota bacterium]|nr:nucleoside monophosphate kinase [Acidobacteriota bacterium]MDQ7087821.1 nucleoside monophosphate kinase [Acidobacteriota bacterium]